MLAYLSLGPCGGVQQFLQLGVHGALQLLPHHFLELSHPSVGHCFTQIWTGKIVEDEGTSFYTAATYVNSNIFLVLKMLLASIFTHFINSNHLFYLRLSLNETVHSVHFVHKSFSVLTK